ncbi:unnamed protein product [Miscanthus lutarioriparius]|uniref:Uncharacterized protein n=1 Tax=Miscanthus lutarioriparius TaxID=422564 RepID=A0A811RND2_9POAL|nr:unnamed protein product [Miscanthus lutarioriparius]
MDKLNAVKEEKGISLMKLIIDKSQYNHNFPVLPPLHEQIKSETEASDDDDVTPSTHPPKRPPRLPTTATAITITAPSQRVIGTTSSAPPGFTPVMSPRSTVAGNNELSRPQIQDAFRELRLAKENLASEQAARAKALEDLEAEQSKTRQLTGQLQVVQAERDKALMQLKEMGAELTVRWAEHTARVRQLEAEHATKVSHLTQLLRTEEGMHMAKVQRLESDLEAAQAEVAKALGQLKEMRAELTKAQAEDTDRVCQLRNAFQAAQAEGAKALGQLKETRAELTKTQAEHTYRVCQLRNAFEAAEAKHVTKVNRLVEERKEVEANLQQLAEELEAEKAKHAAEVNAIRAQCYSQIKADAIKCINELMPEPLPVMGVAGSKVADINFLEESAGVAGSKVADCMLLEEPAAIKQVELMGGEKTHACETDPVHSLLHFERPINKNKMDAVKVIEASTKPACKTKNTVTKKAAASEEVEELMAA